jgi:hypothetical protein
LKRYRVTVDIGGSPRRVPGHFVLTVRASSEAQARATAIDILRERGHSSLWLAVAIIRVEPLRGW